MIDMAKKPTEKKQNTKAKKSKTAAAAPQSGCLDLVDAGTIVQGCADGPHDIDLTLEQIGLISDNQRLIFRECVFNGVLASGCQISRSDIPNSADTTLRQVIVAIATAAS